MYKMVSIDLDGTLLNKDNSISHTTYDLLEKLSKKGVLIIISTGRSMIGIPDIIKNSNFVSYFITSNGASCIDSHGKCIFKNWIKYSDIKDIVSNSNFFTEYLINGKWYIDSNCIKMITNIIKDEQILNYILSTRVKIDSIQEKFEKDNIFLEKINLNFLPEYYNQAINIVTSYVDNCNNIRVWTDKKHKLDLYNKSATKGNTLKQLAEFLGINSNEIIAFGDDDNDIEMLKYVECSVAMKNGNQNVKNISKYITDYDNYSDGVSKFLKYLFNIDS